MIVKVNSLSIEKTLSVSTGGGQLSTRSRKEAQQKLSFLAVVVARCMTKRVVFVVLFAESWSAFQCDEDLALRQVIVGRPRGVRIEL